MELKGILLYGLAIIENLPWEKVWEQIFQNWLAELKEFPKKWFPWDGALLCQQFQLIPAVSLLCTSEVTPWQPVWFAAFAARTQPALEPALQVQHLGSGPRQGSWLGGRRESRGLYRLKSTKALARQLCLNGSPQKEGRTFVAVFWL